MPDLELQDLMLLCWLLVLLGIGTIFACYSILELKCIFCATVCWNYIISFLQKVTTKILPPLSENTLDFGLLNNVGTVKDYRNF